MYNSGHCHPITLFRLQKKVAAQKKRLELKNSNALIVSCSLCPRVLVVESANLQVSSPQLARDRYKREPRM